MLAGDRLRYHKPMHFIPPAPVRRGFRLCALLVMAAIAAGCGHSGTEPVRIEFRLQSSLRADCASVPAGRSLRFYVSRLRLIDATGAAVPVVLDEAAGHGGSQRISLVSLHDGCGQAGDPATGQPVSGRVATGRYKAVEFDLGVPFELNHGNPLTAAPPLNTASMFWTWQSGYKFLRLDIGTDWSFHLGSTGCVSASAVRPPESCLQPNMATIRLPVEAVGASVVSVDFDALLTGIDIAGADNCAAAYGERAHCRRLLGRLGLDAGTGRCIDGCAGQTVFQLDSARP